MMPRRRPSRRSTADPRPNDVQIFDDATSVCVGKVSRRAFFEYAQSKIIYAACESWDPATREIGDKRDDKKPRLARAVPESHEPFDIAERAQGHARGLHSSTEDATGSSIFVVRKSEARFVRYRYSAPPRRDAASHGNDYSCENGKAYEERSGNFQLKRSALEIQAANDLHSQALEAFDAALDIAPDSPKLLRRIATLRRADGRRGEATTLLERLLSLPTDLEDVSTHTALGAVYSEQNRLVRAKVTLRAALDQDPVDTQALNRIGDILRREGHLDDAVATFQRSLAIEAASVDALFGLARTFESLATLPEAAGLYREACLSKQGGRNPNLLSHLGDVLAARGFVEDAIGCYRAAIALDTCGSSSVEAYLGLGLAHWHEQRFQEAEASYRATLNRRSKCRCTPLSGQYALRDQAAQPWGERRLE